MCAALTPWVLLRAQEGTPEPDPDPHAWIFPLSDMTPDLALAVCQAGGESRARETIKTGVAREVVRAYLLARGWVERRGSWHPRGEAGQQLRLKPRPQVLGIEAGGANNWSVATSIPMRGLGQLLLKHARAVAPG